MRFVGTLMLLNKVLPHLNELSKVFQKDSICYTSIRPSLEATKANIANVRSVDLVGHLQELFGPDGEYADLQLEMDTNGQAAERLRRMVTSYTEALETNLDRRFKEATPVFEAFSIFDPTALPNTKDAEFVPFGVEEVKVLCKQFLFDEKQTLAQWQNFKYLLGVWKEKMPSTLLRGKAKLSPTEYAIHKIVKEQAVHRTFLQSG